jgi:hypothetical protein
MPPAVVSAFIMGRTALLHFMAGGGVLQLVTRVAVQYLHTRQHDRFQAASTCPKAYTTIGQGCQQKLAQKVIGCLLMSGLTLG